MKRIMMLCILLTACNQQATDVKTIETKQSKPIDTSMLDTSVRPQDDFWAYVNGKWISENPIPADKSTWGSFHILREQSRENVRKIIDDISAMQNLQPGSNEQKIRDLYKSFMAEEKINREGLKPLEHELARIQQISNRDELTGYFSHGTMIGVSAPFGMWVDQDSKDTQNYIIYLNQSGLGLPDRDYYFDKNEKAEKIRDSYKHYAKTLLNLANIENNEARVAEIYQLEEKLAAVQWTRTENRDRDKTYNKYSVAKLKQDITGFAWDNFLKQASIESQNEFVIRQPSYFEAFSKIYGETSIETWKNYFTLRLLDSYASELSTPFVDASFDYKNRTLKGQLENEVRWKRAVNLVNDLLGEPVGQEYVKRHFPPEAKEKMLELVGNLKLAMADSINRLWWMTEKTKDEARKKLEKFTTKIGYPDKWRDYAALEIRADDLVGNIIRGKQFEYAREINKLGKPIDRTEWFMNPQTVNAYYNPPMNEIVFPAAILQPPFFDMNADDAVNYGGIGVVIGHEIGHGFDDQGRKSDGNGNLRDWWTPKDKEEFVKRTNSLVAQYERYYPLKDLSINGKLTLGENIGDLGGLSLSYRAYRKSLQGKETPAPIDNLTAEQRFLISYAQIWRNNIREEALRQRIKTDPHSPPQYRVMGTLPNFQLFYKAFDVKEGDKMFMPAKDRVMIW